MRIPGAPSLSRAARSGLSTLFAALLGSGGCSFLIGSELSDKPDAPTGAGGGGQGGAGATSTSAEVTSGPSVAVSSGAAASASVGVGVGSSGSGGIKCSTDLADCDGKPQNGCETNIKTDPKNCGACDHKCDKSETCDESECE